MEFPAGIMNNIVFEDDDIIDEVLLVIYGMLRRISNGNEYFNSFDELLFFQRLRMTKLRALSVLEMIEERIEFPYNWNNAVSPINQLLVFLRFCATGSHLACIADFSGVHVATASRIVVRVGAAIASLYNRFVKVPNTEREIAESNLRFYEIARFPRVIGVVDCIHVRIQSPGL